MAYKRDCKTVIRSIVDRRGNRLMWFEMIDEFINTYQSWEEQLSSVMLVDQLIQSPRAQLHPTRKLRRLQ